MDIIKALHDKNLLGAYIPDLSTFGNWLVFFKAVYQLPMGDSGDSTAAELAAFRKFTGRKVPPAGLGRPFSSVYCISGRKSGKSLATAVLAVYAVAIDDFWIKQLKHKKKVYFIILATDMQQASEVFNYCREILNASPVMRHDIKKERALDIELRNGAVIMVRSADYKRVRGPQYIGAALDELAFFSDENSQNPAAEIVKAILPGVLPGGRLIGISSAYGRFGHLYEEYRQHWAKDDSQTLIWVSDTMAMNPTFAKEKIDAAMSADPSHARAEYLSVFREDIETFCPRSAAEACVVPGRKSLPMIEGVQYFAHVDPSGGRADSMTLAIAHREPSGVAVLDYAAERKAPFSPKTVVAEFSGILGRYGILRIVSDRFAGAWVTESFAEHQIKVVNSEFPASDIYLNFLPMIMDQSVELLDHPAIVAQLTGLERRSRSGGKDLVTHFPGSHDDLINAVAGACILAGQKGRDKGRRFYFLDDTPGGNPDFRDDGPAPRGGPEVSEFAAFDEEFTVRYLAVMTSVRTIAEAARVLRVDEDKLRRWSNAEHGRINRILRYRRRDVEAKAAEIESPKEEK